MSILSPIDFLDETLLNEVLCYLTLDECNESTRKVSRSWNKASKTRRTHHLKALSPEKKVKIHGLTSTQGQTLNGRIGIVSGSRLASNGRFPIQLIHLITGLTESKAILPKHLNPFLLSKEETREEEKLAFIKYTSDAKLRVPHGMMLDQLLMLARWEANVLAGFSVAGEYQDFIRLPRSHAGVAQMNSTMFTWWSTSPKLAGLRCATLPILDVVVRALVQQEGVFNEQFGGETKWKADGPRGEYFTRNFCRFMRSWEAERITGIFWVTHAFPTGTMMVLLQGDDETVFSNRGELGPVYLVKGLANSIYELFPSLPACARATLLPVYDCLVYDGIVTRCPFGAGAALQRRLEEHVKKALDTDTVITRGTSAQRGWWDDPPPPLPSVPESDDEPFDWGDEVQNPNVMGSDTMEITTRHRQLARDIAKATKKLFHNIKYEDNASLVFRRLGYTHADNPNRKCKILYSRNERCDIPHEFTFREGITYSLDELLVELLHLVETCPRGVIYTMIQPDELSVVEPLKLILDEAFEAEGVEKVDVFWYPPPSEEETAYATTQPSVGFVGP